MAKKLKKAACFTDIHWGRKNNSELHNNDCMRFVEWFCENVRNDSEIDHIIFLGDWFEHRSSINGLTLDYAYRGACMLEELGLPVYFIVGNHDLYYRHTRQVYSTNFFRSLDNFKLIGEPTVFEELGEEGALICPYLFESEYANLTQYFNVPVWFGHFEFKGFVVTGDTRVMEHGPDPDDFKKPRRIFSGHFHKRQSGRNIQYIGNAFPADFGDANDSSRGMMIYDYDNDSVEFKDWDECPTYIKTKLTELTAKKAKEILKKDARVRCLVDKPISFEESTKLKEYLVDKFQLRELYLEESSELQEALSDTDVNVEEVEELESTDVIIRNLLEKIEAEKINNNKLIKIYEELP